MVLLTDRRHYEFVQLVVTRCLFVIVLCGIDKARMRQG